MTWEKSLQTSLGVAADGIIGRGTLTALFRKLGWPLVHNGSKRGIGVVQSSPLACEAIESIW